jgi:putative intracellular protease/amidase
MSERPTVHVLFIDSFADWEPAILLAELRSRQQWNVVTVGVVDPEVRSMGGLRVVTDALLRDVDPSAVRALLVPGGQGWEQHERPAVTRFLGAAWDAGATIGAICAGTSAAAHAGLLDERPHTSNGLPFLKHWVPGYRGDAHYRDALVVRDGRLVTAPGNGYAEWSRELLVALGVMSEADAAAWFAFVKPEKPTPVTG